jgi:hypothetical protein
MDTRGTGPRQRRLVVVVDVEAYSGRPYAQQQRVQSRLAQALDYACGLAVGGRRRCEQQDRGDGQLLLLPADADEARAVPGLVLGLRDALTTLNAGAAAADRIRLRASLAQGPAQRASLGYVAWSVELACRLLDCGSVRSALDHTPTSDMALIVAADLFKDTFASGGGGMPGSLFRPVRVELPEKRFEADAFVSAVPRGRLVALDGEGPLNAGAKHGGGGRRRGVLLGGTLLSGTGLCLLLPEEPSADDLMTVELQHPGHGTGSQGEAPSPEPGAAPGPDAGPAGQVGQVGRTAHAGQVVEEGHPGHTGHEDHDGHVGHEGNVEHGNNFGDLHPDNHVSDDTQLGDLHHEDHVGNDSQLGDLHHVSGVSHFSDPYRVGGDPHLGDLGHVGDDPHLSEPDHHDGDDVGDSHLGDGDHLHDEFTDDHDPNHHHDGLD